MNDSITNTGTNSSRGVTDAEATESRDILFLSGGAALMLLGAGLVLSHPLLRRNAKAALNSLMPDLQEPLKAGVRGVLPDLERYLRLKGM